MACKIHEDAPNPNCLMCKASFIDGTLILTETERINKVRTETERINKIRDALQTKFSEGSLGVVAARADISESRLRDWVNDPCKVPTYGELIAVQSVLGLEAIFNEQEEFGE